MLDWQLANSFMGFMKALLEGQEQTQLQKLTFVLIGVAKPTDFLTGGYTWNIGQLIELTGLTGTCLPLQEGLKQISEQPEQLLEAILSWSGGQPFLTQLLCHLVVAGGKIRTNANVQTYVDRLVSKKVIGNWQRQDRQSHFQGINRWFLPNSGQKSWVKWVALSNYRQLLSQSSLEFKPSSKSQWELLLSDLATKDQGQVKIANRIYKQVFDLRWAEEKEQKLEGSSIAKSNSIYGRQVFMLVDQSASMLMKDMSAPTQTRYEYLQEILIGDVGTILDLEGPDQQTICNQIELFFI